MIRAPSVSNLTRCFLHRVNEFFGGFSRQTGKKQHFFGFIGLKRLALFWPLERHPSPHYRRKTFAQSLGAFNYAAHLWMPASTTLLPDCARARLGSEG